MRQFHIKRDDMGHYYQIFFFKLLKDSPETTQGLSLKSVKLSEDFYS